MAKRTYVTSSQLDKLGEEVLKELFSFPVKPKIKFLMLESEKSAYCGKCSRTDGKWKYLTDYDYVIEMWNGFWNSSSDNQKKALLYHELMHIKCKETNRGKIIWSIRKHDVEEFVSVIENFGIWNPTLNVVCKCMDKHQCESKGVVEK